MSAAEQETPLDGPSAAREEPQGSILGDLRAIRQAKASEAPPTYPLDIAGYGTPSRLTVVYRYPTAGYSAALAGAELERLGKDKDARVNGNADILVVCCASLLGKRPDGTFVNLDTDEPVTLDEVTDPAFPAARFNKTLAEKFGIEVGDAERVARFVCREVFSPGAQQTGRHEGDMALIAHGNLVFNWLQGANRAADEETAGE